MDFLRWPWHRSAVSKTDNGKALKQIERLLKENLKVMTAIQTLAAQVAQNLTQIASDLSTIANGNPEDVAAVQALATQAAAVQAQADALIATTSTTTSTTAAPAA
jgi:hypothetical protein